MLDTINNPILKTGLWLAAVVFTIWVIKLICSMLYNICFRPKRGLSVEDRMEHLTSNQVRQKNIYNQKYQTENEKVRT
jgi:hypothetical protein